MNSAATRIDAVFATRLRKARVAAGKSQHELGAHMLVEGFDFHPSTVGKIERGQRRVTIGEAIGFAEALGCPLEDLVATDTSAPDWRVVLQLGRRLTEALDSLVTAREQIQQLADDLRTAATTYDSGVDPERDPEFELGQGALAGPYFENLLAAAESIQVDRSLLGDYLTRFDLEPREG